MDTSPDRPVVAFAGSRLVTSGELADVVHGVRELLDADPTASVLVFDAATSEPVELDLRGTPGEAVARLRPAVGRPAGRPRLGVVGREVTLLPRHWEWLAAQPGGASVTLRRLVDQARRTGAGEEGRRRARESAYRFMLALAGNEPGFEAASRALFAGDRAGLEAATDGWPADVRDRTLALAEAEL